MIISKVFDIATNSLETYQQALSITSNNISNADNPDYSRQVVQFGTTGSDSLGGSGVKIADVQRIRDSMIDTQVRNYQSSSSYSNEQSGILSQIESVVAEPSNSGLSSYIADFFNSWSSLAANPNSTSMRSTVIDKAQSLSDSLKSTFDSFSDISTSLKQQADTDVSTINQDLAQINSYNQKIYQAFSSGAETNELQDERDGIINNLSKMVNVSVQSGIQGTANVNIGGIFGADTSTYNQFDEKIINGQLRLVSKNDPNSSVIANSGEFAAINDLYSNKIPAYTSSYQKLAQTLVDKVNSVHMQGSTLVQGASSQTNIPFFGELDPDGNITDAFAYGKININPAILNNTNNIAASDTPNNDGNGNIATQIANLADTPCTELGDQTIGDSYSTLISQVGMDKTSADNDVSSTGAILTQLQTQQKSISGVSIDEELTNVIKYQQSYAAAAKLISTAEAMLQTLIQSVV